ncbi:MAG TPA: hypothetical protein DDY18_07810 [Flavobacterium sp.]|jgi:hypothetical protein|nr:hypothetical protein [Flavobacterium sp.]
MAKKPNRSVNTNQDLGAIDAIKYNDAVGADKVIVVQPTPARAYSANEPVGAGKLILIAAGPYTLSMLGKAYDSARTYQQGDVVTQGGFVYLAMQDAITGTFDSAKWKNVAPDVIAAIPCPANSVVSTGRWHNAISVAGFLIDDDSSIEYTRIRD